MTSGAIRGLWVAAVAGLVVGAALWLLPTSIHAAPAAAPEVAMRAPPPGPDEPAVALLRYEGIARTNVFQQDRSPPPTRYTPGGPPAASAPPATTEPPLTLYGLAAGPSGAVALIDADPRIPGAEIYRVGDRVGPYRLASIADTFVVLAGPAGERMLRLQAPPRRSR